MLKRITYSIAFILFSFSFMRGCDPTVTLDFTIENQTASDVEVVLYGLQPAWNSSRDSVKRLGPGELFVVHREEQMGTVAEPTHAKSIYFIDSIRVTTLQTMTVSDRNFMDIDAWPFRKRAHRLTLAESDFD